METHTAEVNVCLGTLVWGVLGCQGAETLTIFCVSLISSYFIILPKTEPTPVLISTWHFPQIPQTEKLSPVNIF